MLLLFLSSVYVRNSTTKQLKLVGQIDYLNMGKCALMPMSFDRMSNLVHNVFFDLIMSCPYRFYHDTLITLSLTKSTNRQTGR